MNGFIVCFVYDDGTFHAAINPANKAVRLLMPDRPIVAKFIVRLKSRKQAIVQKCRNADIVEHWGLPNH